MKRIKYIALTLLLCSSLLCAGCVKGAEATEQSTKEAESSAVVSQTAVSQAEKSEGTKITLNGSSAEVSGTGANASEGSVTITAAGTYIVCGTLEKGQIYINATKNDTINLVLNGVDITADKNAAIYCAKAQQLNIVLEEGTENKITDASEYTYADTQAEEPDAAVFSKTDLSFSGTGSLSVTGNFNNGIGSKDHLIISEGTYTVNAKNHGIRGRDSVQIADGTFNIVSGSDGIQSNNDEDEEKGFITIENGAFNIESTNDAIQAETNLTINNGTFTVKSGGGYANTNTVATSQEESDSFKGLKAGKDIVVNDGTFTLDCSDDAVHSNSNVTINGGSYAISTGDDGMHADDTLTIKNGNINIETSYEGLEGAKVIIDGGEIHLSATDDGINAAGGSDTSEGNEPFGRDNFAAGGDYYLNITGGKVYVEAQGDGLDSNNEINISGGEVYISGPTSGGDSAIDHDGNCTITGGILVAAGSSGMVEPPNDTSTQPSITLYYSGTQSAGSKITLKDSSGNTFAEFTPEKDYQSVTISCSGMELNQAYTVYSDDNKIVETTVASVVTQIDDSGNTVSGQMGGGPGGMGGGPGF